MPPFVDTFRAAPRPLQGHHRRVGGRRSSSIAFLLLRVAGAPSLHDRCRPASTRRDRQGHRRARRAGHRLRAAQQRHRARRREGQVAQARVALAGAGRQPRRAARGQGFELFDKQKLGASDFQQQVTYQRALEGEIARTIGSVQGVSGAAGPARAARGRPVRRRGDAGHRRGPARQLGRHARAGRGARHRPARRLVRQGPQDRQRHDHRRVRPAAVAAGRRRGRRRRAPPASRPPRRATPRQLEANLERAARPHARPGQGPGAGHRRPQRGQDHARRAHVRQEGRAAQDARPRPRSSTAAARPPAAPRAPARTSRPTRRAAAGGGANSNYQRKTENTDFGVDKTVEHTEVAPGAVNKLNVALVVDKSVPGRRLRGRPEGGRERRRHRHDARRHDPGRARSPFAKVAAPKAGPVPTALLGPLKWVGARPRRAALPVLHDAARCASARARRWPRRRGCARSRSPSARRARAQTRCCRRAEHPTISSRRARRTRNLQASTS